MKKLILLLLLLIGCNPQLEQDYPLKSVSFHKVALHDQFWAARIQINRNVTIPYVFKKLDSIGIANNFAMAGGLSTGDQCGNYPFDDTDIYKTIEGTSYDLMVHADQNRKAYLDSLISLIAAAQENDGYLYTARTNNAERFQNWMGDSRWANLGRSHELYNAGHMYEAAAAHYLATGSRVFLDVAIKNAELIMATFGPGKMQIPPGHQEIEFGLIKLYKITSNKEYLNLAKFFLDERGYSRDGRELWGSYAQDHLPIIDQDEAVGHAVRAAYMYSAMADVLAFTGDADYRVALDKLWLNVVDKKLHVTGGIGAVGTGESFGQNYELPNMTAYNETCSSIANVMWNHRMFLLTGDGKYLDVLERSLYNSFLAGISMKGNRFFYDNPLASRGQHQRKPWLYCACCISNITRFLPYVPTYIYAYRNNNIYINLFASSSTRFLIDNNDVEIKQQSNFPWEGRVLISVSPENQSNFNIYIRIPGWARNEAVPSNLYRFQNMNMEETSIAVNGKPVEFKLEKGFAIVTHRWHKGDTIELNLPMPVRKLVAHENVTENINKVALQRGPLVYCIEGTDQLDGYALNLILSESEFRTSYEQKLLNGVVVIKGAAEATHYSKKSKSIIKVKQEFLAIPYYAWAHRGPTEMVVWLPKDVSAAKPLNAPTLASQSKITSSGGTSPEALNDDEFPEKSSDASILVFRWSPGVDTMWVQYDFAQNEEVSETQVFWLNGLRSKRVSMPKSWRLLAFIKNEWLPVWNDRRTWGIENDKFNKVLFETVKTKSVRLEVIPKTNSSAGIFEWRVY